MNLALAQIRPVTGDIPHNLERHQEYISRAVHASSSLILFPELSLTGYEPTLAQDLAMTKNDSRLDVFQDMSDAHGIIIGVGLPTAAEPLPHISLIFFQPNQERLTYSKRYLHEDEQPYFIPGTDQVTLTLDEQILAPAICYESLLPEHAGQVATLGAKVYLASVAKPEGGIQKACTHYPVIAREHQMVVAMANCVGPSDTFISAGQSGVWNSDGSLARRLNADQEGILLFDSNTRTCHAHYL